MSTETNTAIINCTVCSAPIKSGAAARASSNPVCSLRCSWKTKQQCCQCGRRIKTDKLPFPESPDFTTFCGPLCLDEARRGNWCVSCGCKQVTAQGSTRCSQECMSNENVPSSESLFPSRRTTPGEGENNNNNNNNQQQQPPSQQLSRRASFSSTTSSSTTATTTNTNNMNMNNRPSSRELQASNRVTCSPVQPGSKLWDRITTPFHRSGLSCYQVIQVHNTAADKKAYNSYRLAVDQGLCSKGVKKYGFGGEGNEHKRFVPLMAGCGGHLFGLRLASQLPPSQLTSSATNNKEIGCEIEGYPHVCQDSACDVCRILERGMKLTAVTGRTSHFSVPTLDSLLPWCQDASGPIPGQPFQQKFQAAALVRTVLGNVNVVSDFDSVPESEPPQGFDSVVCAQEADTTSSNSGEYRTDSAFNYNDRGILCEYVVLFVNPNENNNNNNNNSNNNQYQQQQQQY